MHNLIPAVVIVTLVASHPLHAQDNAETRLLRFPAIHGNTVVFTYAGNLYSVSAKGGLARKLTSHDGNEMFARFSPDGKTIAFTGQYDGNTEIYIIPAEGGVPKRLTYTATLARDEVSDRMGPNNIVIGWKNNDEIIFRSRMREWNDFIGQLFVVSVRGDIAEQLPLPRGGFASYSPDGKQLAYNRIFREFRTWKRYRGGMADDVWIHTFDTKKTERITDDPAPDTFPMWSGTKIYFLSDRDMTKRFNLYSFDTASKATKQLTSFTDFDVKYPSLGDNAIVFEQAAYIYRFDLSTEKAEKIPVRIVEDFPGSRSHLQDVSKSISAYEISPDGMRALFSARGDIFTVPAKEGPTRNLTNSPGVHDRNPKWSPDGKHIAYISDASGEDEIHIIAQDGKSPARQLTSGPASYKYALYWSPDSKKILWADKKMRLSFVDVASKQVTLVDEAKAFEIKDYVWSPDSNWIAYSKPEVETMPKIYIYSLEKKKAFEVTDGWYDSSKPEFSGDGKYLFFVSERDFSPLFSSTEWNHAFLDMERIYFVTLAKDTPNPFTPKSDEVEITPPPKKSADALIEEKDKPKKDTDKDKKKPDEKGKEPEAKDKDKKDDKEAKPAVLKIDIDGLKDRVLQLPIAVGSYDSLTSVGSSIYYVRSSRRGAGTGLFLYDLKDKKEASLGSYSGYEISANQKKMLIPKDSSYAIVDLPKGTISGGDSLNLSNMQVNLDRHAERRQIFHECWRQMRDYFYDPGMHGVDWPAVRKKYEVLLPHVHHRADLTYVIGEMISELGAGHAYVGGGDLPKPPRINTGLLGAQLERDKQSRFYKITKIVPGSSWDKNLRSPLAEIGVNASTGDYILAVNGKPTSEMANIFEALVSSAGKQVTLTLNSKPDKHGSRDIVIVPVADEQPLYYHAWVQGNIKKVNDATKGQVGYLHVPDMLVVGLTEFAKHYYPQLRKKALVIDVRGNGGGNVSPQLIERLRREVAMIDMSRDTAPRPDPGETFVGPMVCLMNEFSASDGDLFPYRFRHYKLGKLVGKRSWGGVIGIRGTLPLLDGGYLNKPEFASYDLAGKKWIIENIGVEPDIVVDNDPAKEFAGVDEQLNRAIEVVIEELRRNPRPLPEIPPFPKR